MKDRPIYTCYGCCYYYADKGRKYPQKHCGKNHFECSYYWGEKEVE